MKKYVFYRLLFALVLCILFAGCGKQKSVGQKEPAKSKTEVTKEDSNGEEELDNTEKTVGILMPTGRIQRWNDDAFSMQSQLEAEGFQVELYFAQDKVGLQKKQFKKLLKQQVDCIVVAPVHSMGLAKAAEKAGAAGIPVVSYDRLLCGTDAVDYYVTFDNRKAGAQLAERLVGEAGLDGLEEEARSIEFFMGPKEDLNARYFYQGMMKVLRPYLEDGRLACASGNISFQDTAIENWSEKRAGKKCHRYLKQYYAEKDLDIVASAFDPFSYACTEELQKAGYTKERWPIITGQDSEVEACNHIRRDLQSFSIFKDTRILAQRCASVVKALCEGEEVPVDDKKHYGNQVKKVPAIVCETSIVDKENMKELLVDTGYYTAEQVHVVQ